MRIIQPEGARGSLKWIQRAIEHRPDLLQPRGIAPITWRSPLRQDEFAEYRDGDFLARLDLSHLSTALADFWPARGPQWDALGLSASGPVLVEAKAHIGEFRSPPSSASEASLRRIKAAFAQARQGLGCADQDWTQTYYQYANRLAHLWWLRQNGVEAWLLMVGFLGDRDMKGPGSAVLWREAYRAADMALGLPPDHALTPYILHVEPHIEELYSR